MQTQTEVPEREVKRRSRDPKPKVKTGCITCKSVGSPTPTFDILTDCTILGFGESNVTKPNLAVIDASDLGGYVTATSQIMCDQSR